MTAPDLPDTVTARAELEKAEVELARFLARDITPWQRHGLLYDGQLSDRRSSVRAWRRHLDLATSRGEAA